MSKGTHDYVDDPRNQHVLINLNGALKPRSEAMVSVLDSGFVLGDGVWEGLRLHAGVVAFLENHMRRVYQGAKALDMDIGITKEQLVERIYATLDANNMTDHVHIRLMISRGLKATPYQDPRVTIGDATIVILPEYKSPKPETLINGVSLFTVHVRRGYPDVQDQKVNSLSKHNCIQACIQAAKTGADEALMLDPHGFVATCNSTHFFICTEDEVWTSSGDFCLGGITRGKVIEVCERNGITVRQKNFSLFDVYGADEAFVTGTFAGLAPVREVDGRIMGSGQRGPMVERLQNLYLEFIAEQIAKGR